MPGGNPLLPTSRPRRRAGLVMLVTFLGLAGTALSTPVFPGDVGVVVCTLSPVIAGLCGVLTWLTLDWPDRES